MIDKYLAYLYEQKEKGVITETEYNVKVENMVEYKLFSTGLVQNKRGGVWEINDNP
jgi:hypothetical protein